MTLIEYLKKRGFDPMDAPAEKLPISEMKKYPITQAILEFERRGIRSVFADRAKEQYKGWPGTDKATQPRREA